MHPERSEGRIAVFDLGGTWFRWGLFDPARGIVESARAPAINYLSNPALTAARLQMSLVEFIVQRTHELQGLAGAGLRVACISMGAPVNAHDMTVLGSGPLWGPGAPRFDLHSALTAALPEMTWHVINDVTALLVECIAGRPSGRKTMLITVSSGVGSRLYDHRSRRIPYDAEHGIQGEIGHLACAFELDGKLVNRQCECGGWNHLNAFASGRGIAQTLRELSFDGADEHRLERFRARLAAGDTTATNLLDACVTPLARTLAAMLTLDPDIDRIVMTGGVVHGLGLPYRKALQRTFLREGLYQITERDPHYLDRRLHWAEPDTFSGLRGAGLYSQQLLNG